MLSNQRNMADKYMSGGEKGLKEDIVVVQTGHIIKKCAPNVLNSYVLRAICGVFSILQ